MPSNDDELGRDRSEPTPAEDTLTAEQRQAGAQTPFERFISDIDPRGFNSPVRNVLTKAQTRGFDTSTWVTMSPTQYDPAAIAMSANTMDRAVDTIGLSNPEMAAYLPQQETAMAILPELAGATQDELVGPFLLEALYGEDFDDANIVDLTDEWNINAADVLGDAISPDANHAVMRSLSGLEGRMRQSFLAEMISYTRENDMTAPGAMQNFIVFQYQKAYNKQQEHFEMQTIVGQFGELVAQPFRATSSLAAAAWSKAVAPQDAWYREKVSIGGNMAISWGQDPGTSGYEYLSGTADGIANLVIDPVAWGANMAMGYKLIKGQALLANLSRPQLAARAVVPFVGKRTFATQGVRGSTRFISSRLGMVMGARTTDQLTESPKALRLFKVLSKVDSPGMIVQRIPEWKNAPHLVDAIATSTDPKQVQALVKQGLDGAFDELDQIHATSKAFSDTAMLRLDEEIRGAVGGSERAVARAGRGEEILEADELTRKNVLAVANRQAKKLDLVPKKGDAKRNPTVYTDVVLRDGSKVTLANYAGDGVQAYDLETGKVVGVLIGDSIGVDKAYEGRGIGTALVRGKGLTLQQMTGGTGAISEQGARVINRALGDDGVGLRAVDGLAGYTSSRGVWDEAGSPSVISGTGGRKVILHVDAKVLDYSPAVAVTDVGKKQLDAVAKYTAKVHGSEVAVTTEHIREYAKAKGMDAIVDLDGKLEILNNGKVLNAADNQVGLSPEIMGSFTEWSEKSNAANRLNAGNRTSTWVIDEMPTGSIPMDVDKFNTIRPSFFSGASNSKSWWARAVKARVFGKYPPAKISTVDVAQGRMDLQNFLRYIALPEDDVMRITEGYLKVDFVDRHRFVLNAIQEAGELIDNPLIKHNLIEYVSRGNHVSYGRLNGSEILQTASKSTEGSMSARPFIPSMLSTGVDLPDPKAFSQAYARYRLARNMGPRFRKGYISPTKDKRKALVTSVRRKLKSQYGNDYKKQFTAPEIEAMAYSVVGSGAKNTDGLGAVAKSAAGVNRVWKWTVSAFSISQLVGRFLPWYSRVWLDENFRAAFADLPTVMRNPQRFLGRHRDAATLRRAGVYRAGAVKWADNTMGIISDGIEDVAQLRRRAQAIIPNINELEPTPWTSLSQARRAIASILNEAAIKNDYGQVLVGVSGRRQRVYQRAIDLAQDMGFDATKPEFDFAKELPDIANQGFSARFGLTHATRPLDWSENVTDLGSAQYASVYHQNLVQLTKDPLIRHAMSLVADDMGGARNVRNPMVVLESTGYKRIEPYVREWAEEAGFRGLPRPALLDHYMEQALKPFVREMYAPMIGDDIVDGGRVLNSLAETGKVELNLFDEVVELSFEGGSKGDSATAALLEHARTPEFPNGPPPKTINANMTPYGFMDEDTDDWVDAAKKLPSKVFRFWGERMTQTGMRQPSYVDIFQNEKAARMALGINERAAIQMAHVTSGEIVNNIYFNTKAVTPFLKSMNNVIPFFTAAWEIASTWAYKIPAIQGGMGVGHVNVVRKIDRVTDAMRNLGLLEFDENGQPTIIFDTAADPRWGPGDEISKAGGLILQTPLRLLEHFLNMGHAVRNMDLDIDRGDSAVPDRFQFSISSPVDFQSRGTGTAFDMTLGAQPFIAFAATNLRKKMPLVSQTTTKTATGSFAEFAEAENIDVYRTLALNMPALEAHLGDDILVQLLKGQIQPEDVDLTGVDLQLPNTSLWSTLVDDLFFPYGDTQSFGDVANSFQPSWSSYVKRAFGIWKDGNDADGFVGIDDSSETASATSGQILSAARHMNVETGAFDKIDTYRDEFYALAQPYLDAGQAEMVDGQLVWNGEKPADVEVVNASWDKLTLYSDAVWTRAIEDGASMLMMRGLLAAVLPSAPRFFFDEERALDAYYQGRNPEIFKRTSIDDVMDYVLDWAQDPAGGVAVRTFLESHPEMGPYLVGKTYWGPGGVPPLDRNTEQYFEDLDNGIVKPMPHGAWRVREEIRNNEWERGIAVVEAYGTDPYETAAMTLSDPQGYNELTQPFTQKHHMFMWEDEVHGGEYLGWRGRNDEDQFSIREQGIKAYNDMNQTIWDVIQFTEVTPLMNDAERREQIAGLNKMNAGIREFTEEMRVGDNNYDFLAPWQILRMRWFEEVYSPYLDAKKPLYEALNNADSGSEQDRIWAQLAIVEDTIGQQPVFLDGHEFPPPAHFGYQNKDEAVRTADGVKQITYKAAWLDDAQIGRIVEQSPQLDKYLPTTPMQRQIFSEYNKWYDEIDARFDGGAGEITQKERNRQRKGLEEQLVSMLHQNGLSDQVTWLSMWPIQKLNEAGQLPLSLQDSDIVAQVNGIQQLRAADGYKSVGDDNAGRRALTRTLMQRVATDPQFRADLVELGIQLYGEELPEAIIPKLFFNDSF